MDFIYLGIVVVGVVVINLLGRLIGNIWEAIREDFS